MASRARAKERNQKKKTGASGHIAKTRARSRRLRIPTAGSDASLVQTLPSGIRIDGPAKLIVPWGTVILPRGEHTTMYVGPMTFVPRRSGARTLYTPLEEEPGAPRMSKTITLETTRDQGDGNVIVRVIGDTAIVLDKLNKSSMTISAPRVTMRRIDIAGTMSLDFS